MWGTRTAARAVELTARVAVAGGPSKRAAMVHAARPGLMGLPAGGGLHMGSMRGCERRGIGGQAHRGGYKASQKHTRPLSPWGAVGALAGAAALSLWLSLPAARADAGEMRQGHSRSSARRGEDEDAEIFVVVLTGGPCGGKSTALAHISARLIKLGYRVFALPEIATIAINAGLDFGAMNPQQFVAAEQEILRMQLGMEDAFRRVARSSGGKTVVVCDRGAADLRAYVQEHVWNTIVEEVGVSTVGVRDRRYDMVLHLTTAAIGAEEHYTLANNTARRETPAQARELDEKVRNAWLGHDQHTIIDNSTDFDEKIRRAVTALCRRLGIPQPGASGERQLLLAPKRWGGGGGLARITASWPSSVEFEDFDVVLSLLTAPDSGTETRIKRRAQGSHFTYTLSQSTTEEGGGDSESSDRGGEEHRPRHGVASKSLSSLEYMNLHRTRLLHVPEVVRKERVFAWNNRMYVLRETQAEGGGASQLTLVVDGNGDASKGAARPPAGALLPDFLASSFSATDVTHEQRSPFGEVTSEPAGKKA